MKGSRSAIPLLLVGLLAVGVWLWQSSLPPITLEPAQRAATAGGETRPNAPGPPSVSRLADAPEWPELNRWQSGITRTEFVDLLKNVFTVSSKWREWFHVGENDVLIETGVEGERFRLRFAKPGLDLANPRWWRAAGEMPGAPADRPLEGARVAIDPGHLGGRWARIEERWFQVGDATPVKEGDMTLLVAELLKPRLEALGADVTLVRTDTEPLTSYRPESLMDEVKEDETGSPRLLAERLFYRTAEIRARAERINDAIRPDLVLCLHFNAESWGDPADPQLVDRHHFHLLVNGAYTESELALADHRFLMTRRIVEGTHAEERALARSLADAFAVTTGLPPYLYQPNSPRAVNIAGNPYIWARNLLANRLYQPPVVFLEPYVMNSKQDHARIQAGDYEGVREVAGKPQPSIFREYADAVTQGLADHYRKARAEP